MAIANGQGHTVASVESDGGDSSAASGGAEEASQNSLGSMQGFVEVTKEEHRTLERIFPHGNETRGWGTHLHTLASKVVSRIHYNKWTLREWHRYFAGFSVREWAQVHASNEGRGSRWSVQEWVDYVRENKRMYTAVVWTLIFLNITPAIACSIYSSQARWEKS